MEIKGIKILEVPQKQLSYYKEKVKGNKFTSDEDVAKKLTRNIHLAKLTNRNIFTGSKRYVYGNLVIIVRRNKVVHLDNSPINAVEGWWLNKKKYIEISEKLGITDNKFSTHNKFVRQNKRKQKQRNKK